MAAPFDLKKFSDDAQRAARALVNWFYGLYCGGDRRPVFYDIPTTCAPLMELTKNVKVIQEEFEAIIPRRLAIPRYHEIDDTEHAISGGEKDWRVFMLYLLDQDLAINRRLCPRTCALIDAVPVKLQVFFSILDGGKSVPAHCGPYRGFLRYHLGLRVPKSNPPSFRVKDQRYTWKEGEAILFDDTWEHQVYNESDEIRAVLIVDIKRPMPFVPDMLNRLCIAFAKLTYAKMVLKNLARYTR